MKFRTRLGIGILCILTAVLISLGSTVYISRTSQRLLTLLEEPDNTERLQSFWNDCSPILGMMLRQSEVDEADAVLRKLADSSPEEKAEVLSEITELFRQMQRKGEPTLGFFF